MISVYRGASHGGSAARSLRVSGLIPLCTLLPIAFPSAYSPLPVASCLVFLLALIPSCFIAFFAHLCTPTEDEMCSDAMKNLREEANGLLLVCDSYNISAGGEDFGIENNDEEAPGDDEATAQVNIVVHSFGLQSCPMTKKDFQLVIKKYLKKVKGHLDANAPDKTDGFMAGMKEWIPKMLKEFSEYDFYMGKSCDPDAGLVMAKYDDGATYPTFYYILDGLKAEKF